MIYVVKIPEIDIEESIIWKDIINGDLSLKQAYERFQRHNVTVDWAKLIWNKHVPPSYAMVIWKLICKKLPPDERFVTRGFYGPSMCSICCATEDSSRHTFFSAALSLLF